VLREIARCLRPDGRLLGDSAVLGAGRRHDLLIDLYRRGGIFGRVGTVDQLGTWIESAGFRDIELEPSGAVAYFSARG
jgi:hypothetical protein